jgi:hypothetical protein
VKSRSRVIETKIFSLLSIHTNEHAHAGPLLAPKSYVPPSRPNKFPLVIFNEIWHGDPFIDDLSDDIKELFNVRNYYLDTSDENKCNWMIHVDIARFANEQNLMAYQVSYFLNL